MVKRLTVSLAVVTGFCVSVAAKPKCKRQPVEDLVEAFAESFANKTMSKPVVTAGAGWCAVARGITLLRFRDQPPVLVTNPPNEILALAFG